MPDAPLLLDVLARAANLYNHDDAYSIAADGLVALRLLAGSDDFAVIDGRVVPLPTDDDATVVREVLNTDAVIAYPLRYGATWRCKVNGHEGSGPTRWAALVDACREASDA